MIKSFLNILFLGKSYLELYILFDVIVRYWLNIGRINEFLNFIHCHSRNRLPSLAYATPVFLKEKRSRSKQTGLAPDFWCEILNEYLIYVNTLIDLNILNDFLT